MKKAKSKKKRAKRVDPFGGAGDPRLLQEVQKRICAATSLPHLYLGTTRGAVMVGLGALQAIAELAEDGRKWRGQEARVRKFGDVYKRSEG